MLKETKMELEFIRDINMHLFIEKGMRGGISYIAKRHSKANDKYVRDLCILMPIIFMTQYLPYGKFKWMTKKEINDFNLGLIRENSPNGYILEVDLEYLSELHDFHNDYPLAPEKLKINRDML